MNLQGKIVTIVGAAKSGIAAANLVLELGGIPKITDAKPLNEIERSLKGLKNRDKTVVEAGGHTVEFIQDSDLVIASPGVWKSAQPLQWARDKGIPVLGEIEFASRFCLKPVIAVTGSNGKTTTATLISKVIEAAGKKVCLCGNIGIPFSEHVLSDNFDYFVVEISSFQLELTETFRPYIAIILNCTPNHFDRHLDMKEYFNAKKRIFMNQKSTDYIVLNARDMLVSKLGKEVPSQVCFFDKEGETGNSNYLAVYEVSRIIGIPKTVASSAIASFPGVEHRMEQVRCLWGVEYINDSKATTVESGRWALISICSSSIFLICGGSDKGLDYSSLRDLVKEKVKKIVLLTRDDVSREKIHETFDGLIPIEDHLDMVLALRSVKAQAKCNDKVLFSPMFASYDMFDDYEQRGRIFKGIVKAL